MQDHLNDVGERQIDILKNRAARKWTKKENAARFFWALAQIVFHLIPRPMWRIRASVLRMFGATIGRDVHIHPSVRIAIPWHISIGDRVAIGDRVILYALGKIEIGSDSTISQGAHLCAGTHNFRDPTMTLEKPPIVIGRGVWICADVFVGPNVLIGDLAVAGARSVIVRNVEAKAVVAGNPARIVGIR